MLSKNQLKLIMSLQQKKYRIKHGLFVAEGIKVIHELLNSDFVCEYLYCTDDFEHELKVYKPEVISEKELKKISNLITPNKVFGVFRISEQKQVRQDGLILILDSIKDPGNLGTIIRLCDWFGVEQLICSHETVDCYNSKVVQSTMGSLSRISIVYTNLKDFLNLTKLPIYGALLDGENVYKSKLPSKGVLIMGNESKGISEEIKALITHKITIPRFGYKQETESLNAATATAILLSEFKRS
jgi:TrmH family RNA methyltransferase